MVLMVDVLPFYGLGPQSFLGHGAGLITLSPPLLFCWLGVKFIVFALVVSGHGEY